MSFKKISASEAKKMIDEGAVKIIDVRTPQEYKSGHIKNALLLPVDKIFRAQDILQDKEENILVYCHSGARSYFACNDLIKNGYKNVFDITGGVVEWPYDLSK